MHMRVWASPCAVAVCVCVQVAVLRAADRLLDAAISTVEREEKEQPVTFLGLTAGSTMLRSVGTVGSAAVLAGLKSAIPALERGIAELREHQQG